MIKLTHNPISRNESYCQPKFLKITIFCQLTSLHIIYLAHPIWK